MPRLAREFLRHDTINVTLIEGHTHNNIPGGFVFFISSFPHYVSQSPNKERE
jgi:hypothetical protein